MDRKELCNLFSSITSGREKLLLQDEISEKLKPGRPQGSSKGKENSGFTRLLTNLVRG